MRRTGARFGRRNSGLGPRNSVENTNPYVRWRADTGVVTGATMTWTDMILGQVLSQGTAAAQPTPSASDANFNSQATLGFDGGDSMLSTAAASFWAFLHSAANTVMVCFRSTTSQAGFASLTSTKSTDDNLIGYAFRGGAVRISNGGADNFNGSPVTPALNVAVWAGLGMTGSTGAGQITSSASALGTWQTFTCASTLNTADPTSTLRVGMLPAGTTRPLTGQIAEILIWNRLLTLSERNLVSAYFVSRYGAAA